MIKKLCLIRHGCTDYNLIESVQGWGSVPINEIGKKQIYEAAKTLSQYKWDCIVSSDLTRAKQSADIISDLLGIKIFYDSELREKRPNNAIIGKDFKDLKESDFRGEDYENSIAFYRRVKKAGDTILSDYEGNVIVVSHMEFLRCLILYVSGKKIDTIENGQIILLERNGEKFEMQAI